MARWHSTTLISFNTVKDTLPSWRSRYDTLEQIAWGSPETRSPNYKVSPPQLQGEARGSDKDVSKREEWVLEVSNNQSERSLDHRENSDYATGTFVIISVPCESFDFVRLVTRPSP